MPTKDHMIPFSSGTQACGWMSRNCDCCVKAFKPNNGEPPDFDATQKLVNLGRECKHKFKIDWGFISGEVPIETSLAIGGTEKDFPKKCILWSDDSNDGYKPTPRKPKDAPDNQLCMPFGINEILAQSEPISLKIEPCNA